MHAYQDLMNAFDWPRKTEQSGCKILCVWTKNEENFENFQEYLEIFDQNLYEKLTFFKILY